MKNFISFCAATLFLLACNNKKPGEVTVKSEDGKTTTTLDASTAQSTAEAMQKKTEELQKLTPYTLDEIKAMVPEEVNGVKRSGFNATSAMGTAMAKGDYRVNDSTSVQLSVFDCAGQAGAGIYSMQYLTAMNLQSESDDEYTRTVDFNGGKAIENVKKSSGRCTLTWFAANRLLVNLEGDHTGIDMLKQMASALPLK